MPFHCFGQGIVCLRAAVCFKENVEYNEPAAVGGRSGGMYEMADTAALLRELSSLGVDDETPSAPAPASPRPIRPAVPEKKKKRGLFGF